MTTTQLRYLATVSNSNVDKLTVPDEEPVRLCNYVDVYKNDRITNDMNFMCASATQAEISKFRLRVGDVLITKDSEDRNDIAVPAYVAETASDLVCGYHLSLVRARPNRIRGDFLFWALQSKQAREAFSNAAGGVTRFGLTLDGMKSVRLACPDLSTQRTIADFLDRETARIDQMIEKKQRFLDTAAERWRATLNHEVFPNSPDWERLPPGWRKIRLKYLIDPKRPIMYGIVLPGPNMEEGPMIVKGGDVKPGRLRPGQLCRTTYEIEANYARSRLRSGDLVISIRGGIGDIEIVPPEIDGANLTQDAARIAPRKGIDREWLRYALLSSAVFHPLEARSLGAAVRGINIFDLKRVFIPEPPQHIQIEIAARLKQQEAKLSELREKVELHTDRLQEFRAALITAAVTGHIDVCEKRPIVTIKSDRKRFRLIVGAEIVHRHQGNPKFGRVKLQKELYLAEAHVGISELQGNYLRKAAGPLDPALIEETERGLEAAGYYRADQPDGDGSAVRYVALANAGQHGKDLKSLLGDRADALQNLIRLLRDLDRRAVEAVATLYAVWNDAMMDGDQPDEVTIISGVLKDWHPEKGKKFREADLERWLGWMRRNGLTPRGQGPRTIHAMTRDMFAQ